MSEKSFLLKVGSNTIRAWTKALWQLKGKVERTLVQLNSAHQRGCMHLAHSIAFEEWQNTLWHIRIIECIWVVFHDASDKSNALWRVKPQVTEHTSACSRRVLAIATSL